MSKILGIVGSYRKGGVVDTLVSETLAAAEAAGATTSKIYLLDKKIEFCTNCRSCTQAPGEERGRCIHKDDMEDILKEYDSADGLVIGAPVNFSNVNALTQRFAERLTVFAYWPWGAHAPKMRIKNTSKKAVLITTTAMPAVMGRIFTGALRTLKLVANALGAKPVATIFLGLVAQREKNAVSQRGLRKARVVGQKFAQAINK
jgi:multimeric flavodoxin WrbA